MTSDACGYGKQYILRVHFALGGDDVEGSVTVRRRTSA